MHQAGHRLVECENVTKLTGSGILSYEPRLAGVIISSKSRGRGVMNYGIRQFAVTHSHSAMRRSIIVQRYIAKSDPNCARFNDSCC